MNFRIEQVWIAQDVLDEPLTRRIVTKFDRGQVKVLEGSAGKKAMKSILLQSDPFKQGKKVLRLLRFKGNPIRPCPGTRSYICCNLQILHVGQGCPMDCTYCALQAYLNSPVLNVFVNTEDILKSLNEHLASRPKRFHRICTGEFTDSLALDPITGLANDLVTFFSKIENATLELKTKTDHVASLLNANPSGHVIVSFSVNAEEIVRKEECFSASLRNRLKAAGKLDQMGYKLGFHFDPIIPLPDWEDAYCRTVQEIAAYVRPENIVWVSLGVLRFVPELKEIAFSRFGILRYFHDGFIRGWDGKFRLQVERRIEIYKALFKCIRWHLPNVCVYLCMESPYVWKQALGLPMTSSESLRQYLDEAVR